MASRDYKTPQRPPAGRSGSSMLMGIVIGLLLGLAIALGVALYINKVPAPFLPKDTQRQEEPPAAAGVPKLAPGPKNGAAAPPVTAPASQTAEPPSPEKPRFEFHGILTGSEKAAQDKPPKPGPERATTTEVYYLQVGAFPSAEDADNLKAKLALAGVEAKIVTAELADGKVWHRVRVGPFDNVEQAGQVRSRLKENQFEGSLIKTREKRDP